ncbi:hypothetical protein HNY73_007431 [Argiope bruennichi]|uniref:RING-type domain-containing protein n=1 Tax=Argiope bruennichi TaxID=94029 RepID=A0A8T0FGZ2_ARGBR|nr:hypothetical protein HNY73_007431 [Argiope bruennichi]
MNDEYDYKCNYKRLEKLALEYRNDRDYTYSVFIKKFSTFVVKIVEYKHKNGELSDEMQSNFNKIANIKQGCEDGELFPLMMKETIKFMNELEDKFNLPPVDFKKYDRHLNTFEDYQHVMWNAYDWGYFGTEYVNELQAIAYKLDCKLCEGEMNEKLLEMFENNIKIVKMETESVIPRYFECYICHFNLSCTPRENYETECNHKFHVECLRKYIKNDNCDECPLCHTMFVKDDYLCLHDSCYWCGERKDEKYNGVFCQECFSNLGIIKETLEPLKHNIDWDLVDEEPIPYFMFDEWRKNRNCEKEAERIQLYKEFVNRYVRSISNIVKYFKYVRLINVTPHINTLILQLLKNCLQFRNKKYVMRLESDATKVRQDMSKLNFCIDDAHSFSIFELNSGESNVEYTIYQQIVMDYINHLVNLYENFENKQNASVFEELSLFQINIEKYENQLLANALLEFIGQLPTEAYDALSADFKRAIVNLKEAHTEEREIGVNADLRDCERELTNVKKKYFVYYFSDDQQKYKYIHY